MKLGGEKQQASLLTLQSWWEASSLCIPGNRGYQNNNSLITYYWQNASNPDNWDAWTSNVFNCFVKSKKKKKSSREGGKINPHQLIYPCYVIISCFVSPSNIMLKIAWNWGSWGCWGEEKGLGRSESSGQGEQTWGQKKGKKTPLHFALFVWK